MRKEGYKEGCRKKERGQAGRRREERRSQRGNRLKGEGRGTAGWRREEEREATEKENEG